MTRAITGQAPVPGRHPKVFASQPLTMRTYLAAGPEAAELLLVTNALVHTTKVSRLPHVASADCTRLS
jgi:hypothetical protein